ncbi:hypothetical protein ACXVUM_13085 [Williamsia sp. SKLECPSW1]
MAEPKRAAPQEIRFFGTTTWATRGVRYWWRRAGLLLLWCLICAMSVWFVGILYGGVIGETSGVVRAVLLVGMSIGVAGSCIWGYSLMRRSDAEKAMGVPMIMRSGSTAEERRRAGMAGLGAGVARSPLVLFSQVFVVGVFAAVIVSLCQKYISIEEFEAATGKKAPKRTADTKLSWRLW